MTAQHLQISANDRNYLLCNLNGYLKNFDWQDESEVTATGKALHFIFDPLKKDPLAISAGRQRLSNIEKTMFCFSNPARFSLKKSVKAIFEFYSDPESWVSPKYKDEFRTLILSRIDQKASELMQSTSERCKELFKERTNHNERLAIWKEREEKAKKAFFYNDDIILNDQDRIERYSIGCDLIENQEIDDKQESDLLTIKDVFDSKSVAMELLETEALHLCYFSKRLRADREVIFTAFNRSHDTLKWADQSLISCPQFMSLCLKNEGRAIKYIDNSLLTDNFLYPLALQCNSYPSEILMKCSESLRSDAEKILPIIKYDCRAFRAASKFLKEDSEFILRACHTNGLALTCLGESFWTEDHLLITALKTPCNWFLPNDSNVKRAAISSIFEDFQKAKSVCLGLLKRVKEHSENRRWCEVFGDKKDCLKKFDIYLASSNEFLCKDLTFWSQALFLQPSLITTALTQNSDWMDTPVILEQLKSSNEAVRSCLDQFVSPMDEGFNPKQLARYFD